MIARSVFLVLIVLALSAMPPSRAQQMAWRPERPVEIVVPASAGGSIDATARLIQRILQNERT
jgi:tripartite-type tricarboxylate transporter receptor subunit TctC